MAVDLKELVNKQDALIQDLHGIRTTESCPLTFTMPQHVHAPPQMNVKSIYK